ncbi:hypothetical protein D1B31_18960 [Neobacillus notoginsengisoli]|uniref:Uncharacterized protein n=1 Tax=Neobacillus notoginsengisoli TaxID=1578198 RepID=A0A417YQ87_9BACI|nr:hypothetical protein [Neobacillus notoginsengisoli]RHW35723.1 hypothetical protein D1B31_18960 [Neobacillus notoginsengisoli]
MAFGKMNIMINGCKINVMENGSVVSFQKTVQKRKRNSYKESFGFGFQCGDGCYLYGELSGIQDQDGIDAISSKNNHPLI